MPTVESLLAARRAAVKDLEQEDRKLRSIVERKELLQEVVATAWHAAAGGMALAQATDEPAFRKVLTHVLEERVAGKRNRHLLQKWKAAGAESAPRPEEDATPDPDGDEKSRRQRKAELRRELVALSPDELLEELARVEVDHRQAEENVARARARKETAASELRSRDRHWRVVVGVSVLTQAGKDPDLHRQLDGIFQQRVADKDRVLLARWRSRFTETTAPAETDDAPPDQDGALRGWVPRKLPDKSWGALRKPPGSDLPSELIGRSIQVVPRKGDPWATKIVEVVEANDEQVLVRHAGRPPFPASTGKAPAEPPSDGCFPPPTAAEEASTPAGAKADEATGGEEA